MPALSLWPPPQASSEGTLSIAYVRQLPRPDEDMDVVEIPRFLDGVFVTALQKHARGFEEHDKTSLEVSMEDLKRSALFVDSEYRDGELMPNIGPMTGGHVSASSSGWINWDTGATSALP